MSKTYDIIFSLTNDVVYDQRMQKTARSLSADGFRVLLMAVRRFDDAFLDTDFDTKRISTWFRKGKLFYLEYNIRLFFILLFSKAKIFTAIDTDTLLGVSIAAKLKGVKLVYDAHEYFTELEEICEKPFSKFVWKKVEDLCIPMLDSAYTISGGYAQLFQQRFKHINFEIVENASMYQSFEKPQGEYLLYQGAVNYGRGLFKLVEAMQHIDQKLIICGKGDALRGLQEQINTLGLEHKIELKGFVSPKDLKQITRKALIGFTLFSNKGLSNHYSLCNRFFDYMHAGVPQVVVGYPEYKKFNKQYEVASLLAELTTQQIISVTDALLLDQKKQALLGANALVASQSFCWQECAKRLSRLYGSLINK